MSSVLLVREGYVSHHKIYAELVRSSGINILRKQYKYGWPYLATNYNLLSSAEGLTEQLSTKSDSLRWIICFNQSWMAVVLHSLVFVAELFVSTFNSTQSSCASRCCTVLLACWHNLNRRNPKSVACQSSVCMNALSPCKHRPSPMTLRSVPKGLWVSSLHFL